MAIRPITYKFAVNLKLQKYYKIKYYENNS